MSIASKAQRWRGWFPVPAEDGGLKVKRWVLMEANRMALTVILLALVFGLFVSIGTLWTFEMQRLLVETSAVETILDTLLSGMILLVSIVVSINSIVLSYDMSSVENQEARIKGASEFRRDLDKLAGPDDNPSQPSSFLKVMSRTIRERAQRLDDSIDGEDTEFSEAVREHVSSTAATADQLGEVKDTTGAEFAVLWKGIDFPYGAQMEESRRLKDIYGEDSNAPLVDRFDHLIEAFELFAIGKEYFKTLYYTQEVSRLSQTLLVITLPAILINASTILLINARILPDAWILGLPPLQTFVAATFTISLAPYLVLTAYMLRLAAVARLASSAGIFALD